LYLLTGNDAYLSRAVWAGKGYRYFLDGAANKEPLTELIQTADTDRIRLSLLGVSFDDMYSRFDSEVERFVDTNVDHTRDLEYAAEYAIRDAVEKHASFLPVVSFSGGKDSTVVSSLVSRALANPSVLHLFGDTTLEYPLTLEYLARFRAENRKTPFVISRSDHDLCHYARRLGLPAGL